MSQKASYVRISLPGLNNDSYAKYSRQNKFLFNNAVDILMQLCELRSKYGRENELVIGARCCLRPEHEEDFHPVTEMLLHNGVDSFQIVRAIENNADMENPRISESLQKKLIDISKYKGVHIPSSLERYYDFRIAESKAVEGRCFAAEMTPILYGSHLIPCTHSKIIKNRSDYFGNLAETNKIDDLINIRNTNACETCCAIKDNSIFGHIYAALILLKSRGKNPVYDLI